jgi:hypothetical protein
MKITSLVCVLLFACTLLPAQVAPGFAKGSAAYTIIVTATAATNSKATHTLPHTHADRQLKSQA